MESENNKWVLSTKSDVKRELNIHRGDCQFCSVFPVALKHKWYNIEKVFLNRTGQRFWSINDLLRGLGRGTCACNHLYKACLDAVLLLPLHSLTCYWLAWALLWISVRQRQHWLDAYGCAHRLLWKGRVFDGIGICSYLFLFEDVRGRLVLLFKWQLVSNKLNSLYLAFIEWNVFYSLINVWSSLGIAAAGNRLHWLAYSLIWVY